VVTNGVYLINDSCTNDHPMDLSRLVILAVSLGMFMIGISALLSGKWMVANHSFASPRYRWDIVCLPLGLLGVYGLLRGRRRGDEKP
jgi:hypothetical protein